MEKKSVYEMVTERICEMLEQGEIPWRKPWKGGGTAKNYISKKEYNGINTVLLDSARYGSPNWLTFKQAKDLNGGIKAGEKGSMIVYFNWVDIKNMENEDVRKIPILKYFTVFNAEQTYGIDFKDSETVNANFEIKSCEDIVKNMPLKPRIDHGGGRAFYSPMLDYIQMPEMNTFETSEHYYATLFHELGHATGHENRVGRKGILEPSYFGSHEYSKEELIAEFTSSFLCGHAGIDNTVIVNSAAYIQSWLKALKNDKKMVVYAASMGQKAAKFIMNEKGE